MAKQNTQPTEYSWDTGTYQTGATKPNKGQSVVITVLLIAVIFLGGLASALGLMNVRLLSQLVQQQNAVLPVAVDTNPGLASNFIREDQNLALFLPDDRRLTLSVGGASAQKTGEQILAQNQDCLVTVTVQTSQNRQNTGSALVLSSDGYLLTNAHLMENAKSITVMLSSGEEHRAVPVATDAYSDLAVLYISAQGLTPATFSDTSLTPGKQIYATMECDSISAGKVSSDHRELTVGAGSVLLQKTDFETDHGPVFDDRGQVTGFLCRYFGETENGYMLSARQVMAIATDLVEQGAVTGRPSVGLEVRELSNFCRQYWNLTGGLEITGLTDTTAQAEGLLEGDILLSINGVAINGLHQFYADLLSAQAGESFEMEVFRAGQRFTVTLPVCQIP